VDNEGNIKNTLLFRRLILTFQTAAIQQMGKLTDPITGKIMRNLEQASLSIDTLDMLMEKCKGNLDEDERSFLKHIISELKLNYVDEVGRSEQKPEESEEAASAEDDDSKPDSEETETTDTE